MTNDQDDHWDDEDLEHARRQASRILATLTHTDHLDSLSRDQDGPCPDCRRDPVPRWKLGPSSFCRTDTTHRLRVAASLRAP